MNERNVECTHTHSCRFEYTAALYNVDLTTEVIILLLPSGRMQCSKNTHFYYLLCAGLLSSRLLMSSKPNLFNSCLLKTGLVQSSRGFTLLFKVNVCRHLNPYCIKFLFFPLAMVRRSIAAGCYCSNTTINTLVISSLDIIIVRRTILDDDDEDDNG